MVRSNIKSPCMRGSLKLREDIMSRCSGVSTEQHAHCALTEKKEKKKNKKIQTESHYNL